MGNGSKPGIKPAKRGQLGTAAVIVTGCVTYNVTCGVNTLRQRTAPLRFVLDSTRQNIGTGG